MDHVAVLRRFNRASTQRIGLLEESYLDAGRPLASSRLLFEIGLPGARVTDLRRRLGLDSGYLSRLLRGLEDEGLVEVARDPDDGRQRLAHLSVAGRDEWHRLDRGSRDATLLLLEPLSGRQRDELAGALDRAERLLRLATVRFEPVRADAPVARAALARYYAELDDRFPSGFDPGDPDAATDVAELSPPDGSFLVVTSDAEPAGCGGVQRVDAHTGEIKRMWIHPSWRGLGLGRRLLTRLEDAARDLGRARVVLDTNESLAEAIALYERAGYRATERYNDNPYAHRWFEKDL